MEAGELFSLNRQGLIPGPEEKETDFVGRVHYCLNLSRQKDLPLPEEARVSSDILKEAWPLTEALYDQTPDWIPVFFSNYKLAPWHGGCAWIFQYTHNAPTAAFLQLRQNFKSPRPYYGLYNRAELLAHELAHVGRMAFEEPKFEEILAYRTSKGAFRRLFGPVVQSSSESAWLMFFLIPIFLLDGYLLLDGDYSVFRMVAWAKLVPLGMILAALVRLFIRQRQFRRALQNLQQLPDSHFAEAILYRLTDDEIISFGKMKPSGIVEYVEEQSGLSLRWKLIREAYFQG